MFDVGLASKRQPTALQSAYAELEAIFGHNRIGETLEIGNEFFQCYDVSRLTNLEVCIPGEYDDRSHELRWQEVQQHLNGPDVAVILAKWILELESVPE